MEAASMAQVTGRADLVDPDEQDVTVAVHPDLLHVLDVAAGLALAPQLVPRTAPEHGPALVQGPLHRFPAHPGHHQHLAVLGVLDDGREQASIVECQSVDFHPLHHSLTGIRFRARPSLTSRMESSPEWNRDAASTASARPSVRARAKCSIDPAPPLATTGTAPAALRGLDRPLDSVALGRRAARLDHDSPPIAVPPLRVDRHDHALRPEPVRAP